MKKFTLKFEELQIQPSLIEICMGYEAGLSPEPLPSLIDELFKEAPGLCNIQGGYQVFDDVKLDLENNLLHVAKRTFHPGRKVINLLKNTEKLAIFLCTAGNGLENYSKQLMSQGDPLKGYIVDVIASNIVEIALEKIYNNLKKEIIQGGTNITNTYSPGYCDWSVEEQKQIFSFFPSKPFGITLSESSLMSPVKSISSIAGIGKETTYNGYTCEICNSKSCIYRNVRKKNLANC